MFVGTKIRGGSVSSGGKVSSGKFLGIDSSMSGSTVSSYRADSVSHYDGGNLPGCVNLIRTALGEVSKRAGYKIHQSPVNNIGGVHKFASPDGDKLFFVSGYVITVTDFDYHETVSFGVPQSFDNCFSVQCGKYMMFMNGSCLAVFDVIEQNLFYVCSDGRTNVTSPDTVYTPTMFIAGTPSGAAASFEKVNLFSPFVAEQYISDGECKEYTLHFEGEDKAYAYIKDENGNWVETPVTVSANKAVFTSAPPIPYVEGEDNVRIVYKRTGFKQNAAKIAECRCGSLYGVSGYKDRVFLSANDSLRGYVFYSDMDNPLYFPDTNYLKIGDDNTKVMALAGQDTSLAVICNDNVYTVSGATDENGTVFGVNGIFKTPEPSLIQTPFVFDGEVVYLTENGVCAIAPSGVLDERFCQIRSSFINGFLSKDTLSHSKLIATDEFLVISDCNGRLYLLDGKQFSTQGDMPFSRRQYEGYVWTDVNAKYMWLQDGRLCFSDGQYIYSFNSGFESGNEYRDEREFKNGVPVSYPISAYWETPYIYCNSFHLMKFFMRMGLIIDSKNGEDGKPLNTDVRISVKFDNDDFRIIKDYSADHRLFRYGNISFERFTYRDRPRSFAIYRRFLHKKGRALKLRFQNDKPDEPLTLREFCIEYNIM